MTLQDRYLAEVYPEPPLTAYRRQKNIKDFTIRAKLPQNIKIYPKRAFRGMKKCTQQCTSCPYVKEGKKIVSNKFTWTINQQVNCNTSNIVYMIQCNIDKCKQQYIGQSERKLKERISEHIGYINNRLLTKATGYHFNLPGHSVSNMEVTILERVKKAEASYRREREKYLIRKFNTFYKGMNRSPHYYSTKYCQLVVYIHVINSSKNVRQNSKPFLGRFFLTHNKKKHLE